MRTGSLREELRCLIMKKSELAALVEELRAEVEKLRIEVSGLRAEVYANRDNWYTETWPQPVFWNFTGGTWQ